MTRKSKLMLNFATSLAYQLVTLVCGFVLPRFFLGYYGSSVNGLVSSITQFLGLISFCELGVGAVVQSALYAPLASKDDDGISAVVVSSERFFRRVGWIFCVYVGVLCVVYPLVVMDEYDFLFTALLIGAISVSSFAQYFFGMTYRLLLNADQLGFVQFTIHTVTIILNTVISILLMQGGAGVQLVKLVSSLIFILQPLAMMLVCRRLYRINRSVVITGEPIKQKWNGVAQHVAVVVHGNVGTAVLTLTSTLENVSVFAVYNLVATGLWQIFSSFTGGVQALIGNMIAKGEKKELDSFFGKVERLVHLAVTVVFLCMGFLIVPFVRVYTDGINDAEYQRPLFAVLFTLATALFCLRAPYNQAILAAGHYKQTQRSAFIEAGITLGLSIVLSPFFDLVGIAVALLVAKAYRLVYFVVYLSGNILERSPSHFIKNLILDLIGGGAAMLVLLAFPSFFSLGAVSYIGWILLAIKVFAVSALAASAVHFIAFFTTDRRKTRVA